MTHNTHTHTHTYIHTYTRIHTHHHHPPPTHTDMEQQMSAVVSRVSEDLNLHPPPVGGIDFKKLSSGTSPAQSPANYRRSLTEPLQLDLSAVKTRSQSDADTPVIVESPVLTERYVFFSSVFC